MGPQNTPQRVAPDRSDTYLALPAAPPSSLCFWLLIALATAAFAPCVLVPVWKDYEALMIASRREQQITEHLRADLLQLVHRRLRMETDPAAAIRASRRELGFRQAGDLVVPVDVEPLPPPAMEPLPTASLPKPLVVRRLLAVLPDLDYAAVFTDPATRTLLMSLSGGLVIAAFLIFAPRKSAERSLQGVVAPLNPGP